MAYDVWDKTVSGRDWSLGSDLPKSARGYAPEKFWNQSQMEAKLAEIMSKPAGLFSGKPGRDEAIKLLAAHMKANKIGPTDSSGGLGSEVGLTVALKDQDKLYRKIDDTRYDIRNATRIFGGALFAIAGGLTFLGLTKIYKANQLTKGR
jgi:hypothetical protein